MQVRVEDGSWRSGLRAISDMEEIKDQAGGSRKVVWVSLEDEWQAAQRERREPMGVPWPYEQVEFSEPGFGSSSGPDDAKQPAESAVFLSYMSGDATQARELAIELMNGGLRVWLDPWGIDTENAILERFDDELRRAAYLVLCYSSDMLSPWMGREWLATLSSWLDQSGVKILPVQLKGSAPPSFLSDVKYVNLADDWSGGVAELLRTLK